MVPKSKNDNLPTDARDLRVDPRTNPRIGFFSMRNLHSHVCRCWGYELENTVAMMDSAEIHAPGFFTKPLPRWEPKLRHLLERLFRVRYFSQPKLIQPIHTKNKYDMLMVFCQEPNDVHHLRFGFKNWKNHCEISAVWVDELWLDYAKKYPKQLDLLRDFDYVFMNFRETTAYLREKGFQAYHIPCGIDSLQFSPYPRCHERTIDVLAMGRRAPKTHATLLELADLDRIHYVYDTSPLQMVTSPAEHRAMIANQIKRTKFFVVQKPKADRPDQTGGQDEVGSRFFEGCAGGAIMVGDSPQSPTMAEQFPWDDAIIKLPYNTDDVSILFDEAILPPERMEFIHRQNSYQSLRRHDWAYRWEQVLQICGLDVPDQLKDRKEQLAESADQIMQGKSSPSWMARNNMERARRG